MKAKEKNLRNIKIGESASFERVITESDLVKFANLSGDYNPLHLDKKYAAKTIFGDRIVYGMLICALISRLIGMELPGKRALLMKECIEFKNPARINDKLLIRGIVSHKSIASQLIELLIEVTRGKELIASGSVHVRLLQ